MKKMRLTFKKVLKLFEYKKNNKKQQNKSKLYTQMINIVFLIAEIFYLKYVFLFLFDNTTSHFVYINNIFYTKKMNKKN